MLTNINLCKVGNGIVPAAVSYLPAPGLLHNIGREQYMNKPTFRTIPKQAPTLMEVLVQTQERIATLEARVEEIEESRESEYDLSRVELEV